MREILEFLEHANDKRERRKVLHRIKDIIFIVLCGKLANADTWQEIATFANEHEDFLREYVELENGVPSHDTMERNFAVIEPNFLNNLLQLWNEMLSSDEGAKLRKILAIDGKTQRGNGNSKQKANHIVSAIDENGICFGQKLVQEKTNEIKAIPELLDDLKIANTIITTDAIGTQTEIVAKIRQKRADYCLALKGNQGTLYDDVKVYFEDKEFLQKCDYTYKIEKSRGQIERREYWQTDDISWLPNKEKWKGLKTIGVTRNTIYKNEKTTVEMRYFISSLGVNVEEFARCVRGHWQVEAFHWHLDVTFREDFSQIYEKRAAFNLNIINKMALAILKTLDMKRKIGLKTKRYAICCNPEKYLKLILEN